MHLASARGEIATLNRLLRDQPRLLEARGYKGRVCVTKRNAVLICVSIADAAGSGVRFRQSDLSLLCFRA